MLVVKDDISHSPEDLENILANIRSERPRTIKPADKDLLFAIGGVGIISVRKDLIKYGGSLSYEITDDVRIRAVANWPIS